MRKDNDCCLSQSQMTSDAEHMSGHLLSFEAHDLYLLCQTLELFNVCRMMMNMKIQMK